MVTPRRTIGGYLRGRSGTAIIELAIATAVIIGISMLIFDAYAMVKSRSAAGRVAITMSDFVARETGSDYGDQMVALGQYLYEQELGASVAIVYVISVVSKAPGGDAEIVWTDDTMRFGDPTSTTSLADECDILSSSGWQTMLVGPSATVSLDDGEAVVVTDICAQLLGAGFLTSEIFAGNTYRVHVTPFRTPEELPSPP